MLDALISNPKLAYSLLALGTLGLTCVVVGVMCIVEVCKPKRRRYR